jgi:hypothetical protein
MKASSQLIKQWITNFLCYHKGIHCYKQSNVLKKTNLSFNKEGYLYTTTYLLSKFIRIHAKIHFQIYKAIC